MTIRHRRLCSLRARQGIKGEIVPGTAGGVHIAVALDGGNAVLLLQVCHNLTRDGHKVLYVSGEESAQQIKLRAQRIGDFKDDLMLLCETNLELVRSVIEKTKPEIVVIDSIQTMYHETVSAAPGSVSQVREATNVLMQIAKGMGISIFLVGHVTKEGASS